MLSRSNFCILFLILVFGFALCFTNGFADNTSTAGFEASFAIPEGSFDFPTAEGPEYIQGTPEFQRGLDSIFGTPDFEKVRDLPTNSRDYILGRKVGMITVPQRDNPERYWICTGFLVGPDLFLTNHHCIHDELGLLPLANAKIYMDYLLEPSDDPTRGGITARVLDVLRMDIPKDYALLRLDKPIGNTYGWLELDTTTRVNPVGESVKLISHNAGRSKEIVRRNSEIVAIPPDHPLATVPFPITYLADTQGGSSGSPVFLREGTIVVGINHSSWFRFGVPTFNAGSLMSYIVPEIEQWLPGGTTAPDLVVEDPGSDKSYLLPGESFMLSATVRNQGSVASPATTLRFYQSFDNIITASDVQVGTAFISSLEPFERKEVNIPLTVPFELGRYYYGACVDSVPDEEHTDNNCSAAILLTVSTSPPVHMFWTAEVKIQRANLNGTDIQDLVTGLPFVRGLAVDVDGGKMYWTDARREVIQRANLDGSNIEDIVTGLADPLNGIALDVAGNKIYWTDSGRNKIQCANLDGSNVQDLVTGLTLPYGLALDVAGNKMYWTDITADKIQRANLDGSHIEDLVTTGLGDPSGLALDVAGNKMYWTDITADKIQRANLDGSHIEDLVTIGLSDSPGLALDVSDNKMYWTEWAQGKIQRANLDGSHIEDLVPAGLSKPFAIALGIPQTTPPPPEPSAPVDVNGDGEVTVIDLAIVALFYGTEVPFGVSLPADVNADGIVDLLDLTLVAEGIDAAGGGTNGLSLDALEAVLEAVAEQAAGVEDAAEAPMGFDTRQDILSGGIAYRNVAAALTDARLEKGIPAVLKQLLQLLTEMRGIPETTALLPNYPNPFNPETWIPYQLAKPADVSLTIYDTRGVAVRALTLGHQAAGIYESRTRAAYWDGRNASGESVASGVYFYTLTAGEFTATRKLLIIK